jgi:hypothetical protein
MVQNYPLMSEIEESGSPSDRLLNFLVTLLEMDESLAGPVSAEMLRDVGRVKVSYDVAMKSARFSPDLVLAAAKYRGPAAILFSADISFSEAVATSKVLLYGQAMRIGKFMNGLNKNLNTCISGEDEGVCRLHNAGFRL